MVKKSTKNVEKKTVTLSTGAAYTLRVDPDLQKTAEEKYLISLFAKVYGDSNNTQALLDKVRHTYGDQAEKYIVQFQRLGAAYILSSIVKSAPVVEEFMSLVPQLVEIREECQEMFGERRMHVDTTKNYMPGLLFAYMMAGLFDFEATLDFHQFEKFEKNLRLKIEDPVHHHTGSAEYFYRCGGATILGMVPQDENGVIYAINPLFEMSKAQFLAMISDVSFDVETYAHHMASTILTRLTTPGMTIPVAHEDYQDPVVAILGGIAYQMEHTPCTSCGKSSLGVKKWLFKEGFIVAQPRFYKTCEHHTFEQSHCEDSPSKIAFSVDVPTGDVFFADWIRDDKGFGINSLDLTDFDICFPQGRMRSSKQKAEHNLIHGSIGNEACFLYANAEKTILLIMGHASGNPEEMGLTRVGRICTDLWGYTLMDKAHLMPISSPKKQANLEDQVIAKDSHSWEMPGMLNLKSGQYWHYYFNKYESKILPAARAELPEHVYKLIEALNPDALHGVLIHKDHVKI